MNLEAKVFKNSRGQQLVGVLHHAKGEGPHPCVVVCHGFAGTKTGGSRRFIEFAREASNRGLSVFRFDFAGSGDSEGDLKDLTLDNELEDVQAAFETVCLSPLVDEKQVGILGHCMGGVAALRASSRIPNIYKTIAWAPFSDIDGAMYRLIGEDAYEFLKDGEEADFIYNNELMTCGPEILTTSKDIVMEKEMSLITHPLLIIHGTEDATVPLSEVEALVTHVNTVVPFEMHVIEGAHHSFPYHKKELFEKTIDWFFENKKGGNIYENKSSSIV